MSIVKWLTFQKGVKASHFTAPFPYPPASWGRSGAGAPLLSGGARVAKKVARQGATNGKARRQSGDRDGRSAWSRACLREAARRVGCEGRGRRPEPALVR